MLWLLKKVRMTYNLELEGVVRYGSSPYLKFSAILTTKSLYQRWSFDEIKKKVISQRPEEDKAANRYVDLLLSCYCIYVLLGCYCIRAACFRPPLPWACIAADSLPASRTPRPRHVQGPRGWTGTRVLIVPYRSACGLRCWAPCT
jgi:hypothetical protein